MKNKEIWVLIRNQVQEEEVVVEVVNRETMYRKLLTKIQVNIKLRNQSRLLNQVEQ